ncbi:MAG: flagellar export protein FliJ [Candidatus Omnitrophica bacterium]|nr:flagellar export protein FliJ [Candidatus Omnitrophota bacterium]
MKKFKFRLEKVLDHKIRLYEIAWSKHVEAMNILRREEAKLHSLRDTYKTCLFELATKMSKNFRIRELGPYYRYISFIKKEITQQSQIVCQALQAEEARRKNLMHASKEKEVLNKLKDRRHDEYIYNLGREEQKFLDDITGAKYARGLRSG